MIKNIKLFVNKNNQSLETAKLIKDKLINNGYIVDDKKYDLAIAVGGDGSFLRMVKQNNFNSDICYIGINSGHLGFMQEVKVEEIDKFISELKEEKYKIDEIGIQETIVNHNRESSKFYSLNEIVIRDKDLKVLKLNINIDNDLLENFMGDGVLISTSSGSTAHNLSYGGSIVYSDLHVLELTPIAPLNSRSYRTLSNSVIIPEKREICIMSNDNSKNILLTCDGENYIYNDVEKIEITVKREKIKCLRMYNYDYTKRIYEKMIKG